ncbi:acetylxylan esterase [Maribacter sp. ANRC-HE7]|uniref:Acetylxylan esterase n=1 Tax=Maribacter aquimaris TaxID=2737171 RepID=A0ABR7V0V3_9FLAO|nr:alpha/beta fold hydrolase [Maribacter aquimaris]MBD0776778.1 acetylxylan esterase [Maribacter aquimaris]
MMKYSKNKRNWLIGVTLIGLVTLGMLQFVFGLSTSFPVAEYYEYDKAIPLRDTTRIVLDTTDYQTFSISYNSVHDQRVSGLLSIPKNIAKPIPTIILMHGLGDHKAVDYVAYGNESFLKNGYAVLRIDISGHGERKKEFYDFDLTGPNKYWTRNIVSQTVFDLRRAIDLIETKSELDPDRIGYYGISLGGIIGSIFCGVDHRVKVPVLALAGGQLNLLYGKQAVSKEVKDFLGIIEPLNFIADISPRPLLMLNAKNDEIVPPIMSKLLYKKAKKQKEIIWYDAKHRDAPLDIIYGDGLDWFNQNL